jgi:hypothetical protein
MGARRKYPQGLVGCGSSPPVAGRDKTSPHVVQAAKFLLTNGLVLGYG